MRKRRNTPVDGECAERLRFVDDYGRRTAELARLLHGLKPTDGDVRDTIIVNRARSRCDEAWRALEQHIQEHGCGAIHRKNGPLIPRNCPANSQAILSISYF